MKPAFLVAIQEGGGTPPSRMKGQKDTRKPPSLQIETTPHKYAPPQPNTSPARQPTPRPWLKITETCNNASIFKHCRRDSDNEELACCAAACCCFLFAMCLLGGGITQYNYNEIQDGVVTQCRYYISEIDSCEGTKRVGKTTHSCTGEQTLHYYHVNQTECDLVYYSTVCDCSDFDLIAPEPAKHSDALWHECVVSNCYDNGFEFVDNLHEKQTGLTLLWIAAAIYGFLCCSMGC
eukprot:UN06977